MGTECYSNKDFYRHQHRNQRSAERAGSSPPQHHESDRSHPCSTSPNPWYGQPPAQQNPPRQQHGGRGMVQRQIRISKPAVVGFKFHTALISKRVVVVKGQTIPTPSQGKGKGKGKDKGTGRGKGGGKGETPSPWAKRLSANPAHLGPQRRPRGAMAEKGARGFPTLGARAMASGPQNHDWYSLASPSLFVPGTPQGPGTREPGEAIHVDT